MFTFTTWTDDHDEVVVTVTNYVPATQGRYYGAPEDCWPDDPSEADYEVTLPDGTPLPGELISFKDTQRIECEIDNEYNNALTDY